MEEKIRTGKHRGCWMDEKKHEDKESSEKKMQWAEVFGTRSSLRDEEKLLIKKTRLTYCYIQNIKLR